ncbi:MAG: T9SS type A sorting domain-containing protein [Saprospiraceae bacterium]
MKQLNTLLLLACMTIATTTFAQRYVTQVFDEVQVTQTVPYGFNASIINLLDGDPGNDAHPFAHPLVMDIYQPAGDTATERPVVIYFHTGNFFPFPANGSTGGTRSDSSCVEICTRLAKMGYVAASADYRLGWNPFDPDELTRRWFLINAAYRGVQDARTAIRYFKKTAAEAGNPYGIDPGKVVLWGQGTGGYISLNANILDDYNKTLIPKFLLPGPIPMILELVNGDVWGTSVGQVPPGYPIFTPGDTLCYPNHVGYDSDFQLCVNLGGAMGDSSWQDPGQPPMINFHVPTDSFAPYVEGIVLVPGFNFPVVEVQGSYIAAKLSNEFGNNDVFANAVFDDPYTAAADSRNDGYKGLFPLLPEDPGNNAPWDFWSWDNPNATELADSVGAKIYIDSIMNFFAPRACLVLGLGCDLSIYSATEEVLDASEVGLKISPNPATSYVKLETNAEYPIERIYVYDMNGRLVKAHTNVKATEFEMQRNSLSTGTYVAKVVFKDGFVTQKIMFN